LPCGGTWSACAADRGWPQDRQETDGRGGIDREKQEGGPGVHRRGEGPPERQSHPLDALPIRPVLEASWGVRSTAREKRGHYLSLPGQQTPRDPGEVYAAAGEVECRRKDNPA